MNVGKFLVCLLILFSIRDVILEKNFMNVIDDYEKGFN